jgi:hypothetical protein
LAVPPAQSLARLSPALSSAFQSPAVIDAEPEEVYEPVTKRPPVNLALRDWSYLSRASNDIHDSRRAGINALEMATIPRAASWRKKCEINVASSGINFKIK